LESDGDCLAARNNVHSHARITLGLTDEEKLALAAEWMICADYQEPDPPARLMGAVEKGDTDIVTAWRPERHAGMGRDAARGRDLDSVAYVTSISSAPDTGWGQTISLSPPLPSIPQVPAELVTTTTPWA
jgi:hypothetical protein